MCRCKYQDLLETCWRSAEKDKVDPKEELFKLLSKKFQKLWRRVLKVAKEGARLIFMFLNTKIYLFLYKTFLNFLTFYYST